ncbi:hypothetical protein [Embleya sp. NPDC005971]|uniref:hypothetical protein n=1 Tax=unclassified Embleya TaxID=2699296 RepID=UPI0033F952BA
MPSVPQIRRILFNDEEIGMGFNSETGQAIGSALEGFTIQENVVAGGGEARSSITILSSHEELMDNLGMGFEAQGRYGFFSASAKAKFSERTNFNSTSTFLLAQVVVENPLKRGKGFKVTPDARALLDTDRVEEFKRAFGDSFIRGLQTGGEFYTVIRITSVSTSTQSELAATLQAEFNGLVAAGSFKAEFAKTKQSASTSSEFTATMFQNAGTGAELSPIASIEDAHERFKRFPEFVKTSPTAYEAEVATYDTLPLPLPTPEEREDFLLALADAREKKHRYLQIRNDLQFALQNPAFFQDLPPSQTINDSIALYTKLINGAVAHAIKLSRGQITPPQLFDPGALTPPISEPSPIALTRVQVAPVGPVSRGPFLHQLFDVPESFQATVKLTVRFPVPSRTDQYFVAAGIARFINKSPGGIAGGIGKCIAGPHGGGGVQTVGYVDYLTWSDNVTLYPWYQSYSADSIHLRITVENRKLTTCEYSNDGQTWMSMQTAADMMFVEPGTMQLALFAWSEPGKSYAVTFSSPEITSRTPPQG